LDNIVRPSLKKKKNAGQQWLTPVILATWEAEIEITSKMEWRSGSSGNAPVVQAQSPEFKP
jgi:hypothetical protein